MLIDASERALRRSNNLLDSLYSGVKKYVESDMNDPLYMYSIRHR